MYENLIKGTMVCNLDEILFQRKKAKMPISTQIDLAKEVGLSKQQINNFVRGVSEMPAKILYRVAYVLEIPADKVYTFTPEEDLNKEKGAE